MHIKQKPRSDFFLLFSCCLWSHGASAAHIEEDPDEEVAARAKLWLNVGKAGRGMQSHSTCWGLLRGRELATTTPTVKPAAFQTQLCPTTNIAPLGATRY